MSASGTHGGGLRTCPSALLWSRIQATDKGELIVELTADEKERLFASSEGDLLIMQGMVWRIGRSDIDTIEAVMADCAQCANIAEKILPHPIITAGVPSCERCAKILTR